MMQSWVVLRCSNAHTLKLADSLNASGIKAWSPVETIKRRVPRKTGHHSVALPLLPSFVFADADHTGRLLALSNSWDCPHPGFWVYRGFGEIPTIRDRELDALRVAESRGRPKDQRVEFKPGDKVRNAGAGLEGLPGQVSFSKGKFTFVLFGSLEVKVPTDQLLPHDARKAA